MWHAGLDEAQAGIKIAGRNINSIRNSDDTTLMVESEEIKSLLMKVIEESEKLGLKLNIQKTKIMASVPSFHRKYMGKQWKQWETLYSWAPKSLQIVSAAMKLKDACSLEESYDQLRQHIKKQRHYFANKSPSNQSYGFSSSHIWMWELDYKESWAPENWCFWTVVWEKTLKSPLDSKEIQPVHPKGCTEYSLEGLILKLKFQYFSHLMRRTELFIGKDPGAGKDWRWKEKGTREDEMVEWHHWLNGHEFE